MLVVFKHFYQANFKSLFLNWLGNLMLTKLFLFWQKPEKKMLAVRRETMLVVWYRASSGARNAFEGSVDVREIKEIRPGLCFVLHDTDITIFVIEFHIFAELNKWVWWLNAETRVINFCYINFTNLRIIDITVINEKTFPNTGDQNEKTCKLHFQFRIWIFFF